MKVWLRGAAVLYLLTLTGQPAKAGLTIKAGSVSLSPGSTGSIDVEVFSDDIVDGDKLQAFGIRLQLDTAAAGLIQLGNPLTNGELLDADYVFAGNSDAIINGSTASVTTIASANDTYDGADFTANSSNASILDTGLLLVRLNIEALPGAVPGDYPIRLVDAISTFFEETDAGPVQLSFVSNPGRVTVVPEPSFTSLFGLGFASLIGTQYFRARRLGKT